MPDADPPDGDAPDAGADLALMSDLAGEAGRLAMRWFGHDPQVWMKEGQSPVSEADFAVDTFLKERLLSARPDYGWLSEETVDDTDRRERARVFVVDPIDGTRGFLQGDRRWCVSAAVVEGNRPIAGVLECPALGHTFRASAGGGVTVNGEPVEPAPPRARLRISGPKVFMRHAVASRAMPDMEHFGFVPSLAYRIALVATGEIDVAFARASASDWDLAAADVVASEAGILLTGTDCEPLLYNCASTRHGVLVACRPELHASMCETAQAVWREHERA